MAVAQLCAIVLHASIRAIALSLHRYFDWVSASTGVAAFRSIGGAICGLCSGIPASFGNQELVERHCPRANYRPSVRYRRADSIAAYSAVAYQRYDAYRVWLGETRTDGVDFEPSWIRNFLAALALIAVIWAGFVIAKWANPARDYFDQFPLYVGFSGLVLYLGIAGWRHSETPFPVPFAPAPLETIEQTKLDRDWTAQGSTWLARIDAEQLWRDPALTLAGLARILGTNTTYLSRELGAAAGENFNAIINRHRVAEMQRLLAIHGEHRDLLTLALDVGFNSKASFNRAFLDFAGMSPTQWRLKSQKSAEI